MATKFQCYKKSKMFIGEKSYRSEVRERERERERKRKFKKKLKIGI